MKKNVLAFTAVLLLGAVLLSGCVTAPPTTTYVDPNGNQLITSVGRIDIQDFAMAADAMVRSLTDQYISQDKLKSAAPGEPALMAISRIQNNTGQQFDMDLLVKKITVALNRTGKIQTSTTMGIGGPVDPLAADQQKAQEFFNDQKHSRLPDYTLSGKIIEARDRAGSVRQASYVFQLSLSSASGVAVWEEEKIITKQGTAPAVGF
jgi:PBP1b-binding outer membrane lipoprotein LpoB